MKKKQLELALQISAVALAIGVFLPLTKLPIIGYVSYFDAMNVEAILVAIFAISGPLLSYLKNHKFAVFSVAAVWITILFPAIRPLFKSGDTSFASKLASKTASATQEFASNLFMNIFELSWGGLVLVIGLLAFTATGIMRSIQKK